MLKENLTKSLVAINVYENGCMYIKIKSVKAALQAIESRRLVLRTKEDELLRT